MKTCKSLEKNAFQVMETGRKCSVFNECHDGKPQKCWDRTEKIYRDVKPEM